MAFNGTEGRPISLSTATRWTQNYRDKNPGEIKAIFFGKDRIQQLLAETSTDGAAMGIRIYFAIDDDGHPKLILVPATANQSNILVTSVCQSGAEDPILDNGHCCPPDCPPPGDPLGG